MTKGLKIWLWIILVLNGFAVLGNIITILANPIAILYVALNIIVIVGIILILFQQKKVGLFLYAGCALIALVLNITLLHANIITSILMAIIAPGITYLLMKKNWNEFN